MATLSVALAFVGLDVMGDLTFILSFRCALSIFYFRKM
ncbi:hypothetical protein Mcup_1110 [Metallosphaera cuprina Ar-4]|uniref:Uncharacterized protein n=1 Tax=Metallosphaera cuprina (strain Ar-4) TaxID=1006006 RepID=F4G317_METCR|nr:hypothetical protein Mcup_1110 [Metallosphaera cuprina Ar-4]